MSYKGKASLVQLAELLVLKGVHTAVISPGSRNAPLIAALNRQDGLRCLSIVDERSAAFFALGIAQQTRKPVALACTSGTASLNYAPAIAEAYYQQVPLIILTADRPPEWIDQGDGQTIRQHGLYANYILKSIQLPSEPLNESTLRYNARLINQAIDTATFPICGPVHINIPLSEPLYKETGHPVTAVPLINRLPIQQAPDQSALEKLAESWNSARSKLVITGLLPPDPELNTLLHQLDADPNVAVFTETTSNLSGKNRFPNIDPLIEGLMDNSDTDLFPEILLTMGGHVVSRKIKAWLQKHKPRMHWHIAPGELHTDTYRSLTCSIPLQAKEFLSVFIPFTVPKSGNYHRKWSERQKKVQQRHLTFLQQCQWSDLKAFEVVLSHIPANSMIQAGNSTPIRYLQLFKMPAGSTSYGNRGVSGIDGCMSTAVGAAYANPSPTVLITGDVAFFYDSNALWNSHLTRNLRIIVMNNGGGNIFRIIEGPDTLPELEEFIETSFMPEIQQAAKLYGLSYYLATDSIALETVLPEFFDEKTGAAILEIKTQNKISASTLRDYFNFLQS